MRTCRYEPAFRRNIFCFYFKNDSTCVLTSNSVRDLTGRHQHFDVFISVRASDVITRTFVVLNPGTVAEKPVRRRV